MSSSERTKNIRAVMIIEVIGKPPEHLVGVLENIINEMGNEEGVEVIEKKINEPVLMKDQKDFYMDFAEVEIEVKDINYIAMLMFKYMPAHVEIIFPESIHLTNNECNDVLNEIIRRLHGYDEIARIVQAEKVILEKKLKESMEESKKEKEKK